MHKLKCLATYYGSRLPGKHPQILLLYLSEVKCLNPQLNSLKTIFKSVLSAVKDFFAITDIYLQIHLLKSPANISVERAESNVKRGNNSESTDNY